MLPGLEGAEARAAPCRLNGSPRMEGVLEFASRALGGWRDPWPPGSLFTQCSGQEPQSMDTSSPPSSLRTSRTQPLVHIPQSSRVPSLPTTLSCQLLLQCLGGEGGHPHHSPLPQTSTTFSSGATPLPWPLGSFGGVGALLFCFNQRPPTSFHLVRKVGESKGILLKFPGKQKQRKDKSTSAPEFIKRTVCHHTPGWAPLRAARGRAAHPSGRTR